MKVELKVGILGVFSIVLIVVFAYLVGLISPLSDTNTINVMFNYAGGIEEGSPVRVMGIKVGKVKSITFTPDFKNSSGEEVKLKIKITVDKKAWTSVRKDSKYFINLAGVIGEKFLEISPGSLNQEELKSGDFVRGEDPPRIDQIISQSYGLAGKVIEMLNKNEGSVSNVILQLDKLTTNFNKTLVLMDKVSKNKDMVRLIDNAIKISDDLAVITTGLRSKKAEDSYDLLHKLLFRLEPLDGPAIRKFLQAEGIKAKIF
ncbi:MAG: MCE family protein [Deltaproteobacteria bacterium]|nr:MCE family protein [Deltaproteobacteria bacterium]